MGFYVLKRFLYSILTLLIVVTVTFMLMHEIPGSIYTGEKKLPAAIERNIKAKYGLDQPLYRQYLKMLDNLAHLDFGDSMISQGRSVNKIIGDHFPVSAKLGLISIFLCLLAGIPLGIASALHKDKWQDYISMIVATLGVTIPSFVVATLSQYFLSVKLGIFPVIGFKSVWHAVLPAVALSFFPLSFIARLVRSSMVETLEQDFIRTARAKGLSESTVVYKHALKNALLPVVTYLGPLTASILTGSFIIERIFNIPGLGRYFVDSISNRDYTVIMGVTVFYAVFLIIMNFIVDIIYLFIDPRIKLIR
ncbi:MAG: ABC transporter permease [Clostridia bacterium]|nr:ABC transporter permease [Clostridia bacterium]